MKSIEIVLSKNKEVRDVVRAAFPSYRKLRAYISVWPGSININSYWSGGSRDEYAVVELSTMRRHLMPTRSHPYFEVVHRGLAGAEDEVISVDHVGNVTLKVLPEGFVLVRAGVFCGKPATAHIYVPAANMPRLLSE